MNTVALIGRPTGDPEVKRTQDGKAVARWTLAVDRRGSEGADFISCNAWNGTAELVEKYVKKGMKLGVEGRIRTGNYEKDGLKVYTTDVIVNSVEFLEKKNESSQPTSNDEFMTIPDGIEEELPFA